MKYNYLRYGVLALLVAVGTVSCSDDDTMIKPEPSPVVNPALPEETELNIGTELFDVKKESTITHEIVSGAGDYRVTVLDPSIASATIEGNTISVTGLVYGQTEVLISDQGGSYKSVKTNVYLSDVVVLSTDRLDLTLAMGAPADASFTINQGNPPYSVESAADQTATATLADDGTTVNVRGLLEGETTITVTDARGLKQQVAVANTATDSPFSSAELEAIKAEPVNVAVINSISVTGGSFSGGSLVGFPSFRTWGIWNGNYANGRELFVTTMSGEWIDLHEVKKYDNMYVIYREKKNRILNDSTADAHVEVIKSENDTVWITFWTQTADQTLYKGYIVVELDQ